MIAAVPNFPTLWNMWSLTRAGMFRGLSLSVSICRCYKRTRPQWIISSCAMIWVMWVGREGLDFTSFNDDTFPFGMRQPPSPGNALGLVKFMFPNRHNIYLHDTPAKNLFGREVRAFSHGCIRLADPFDFAYALLAAQSDAPKALFQEALDTGEEGADQFIAPHTRAYYLPHGAGAAGGRIGVPPRCLWP